MPSDASSDGYIPTAFIVTTSRLIKVFNPLSQFYKVTILPVNFFYSSYINHHNDLVKIPKKVKLPPKILMSIWHPAK